MGKRMINFSAALLGVATMASSLCSCSSQQKESPMKAKVEEYASVELKSDLVNNLSDKEKELVRIFFQVGKITDDLSGSRHSVIKACLILLPTAMRKSLP